MINNIHKIYGILLLVFLLMISSNFANADQRSYVWTYEYMIMDPGKAEFENYTTLSASDAGKFEGNTAAELNFELEVGMNRFFDFAIYQNFMQAPGGNLQYSGFKLRSRFKIGKKDQFFMDPLIYVEYKGKPDFHKHEIETKLILAKDFGKFNVSLNPYIELEFEDEESEFAPKYAAGINYRLTNLFAVSMEFKGDEHSHYLGPTIMHGGHDLWFALGGLFRHSEIDPGTPEFMTRLIVGVGL